MSLKLGKAEKKAIADALDQDHETLDDAVEACLEAFQAVFEKRAKFVVVGQLAGTRERQTIPSNDPEAIKVSLGWYSTEGDARSAAESLWHSTASGDTYRTWVLPVFHGSPAELGKKAKEKYEAAAEKAKEKELERIRASVAKTEREAAERSELMKAPCLCGHFVLEHHGQITKAGRCAQQGCRCEEYKRGDAWS